MIFVSMLGAFQQLLLDVVKIIDPKKVYLIDINGVEKEFVGERLKHFVIANARVLNLEAIKSMLTNKTEKTEEIINIPKKIKKKKNGNL